MNTIYYINYITTPITNGLIYIASLVIKFFFIFMFHILNHYLFICVTLILCSFNPSCLDAQETSKEDNTIISFIQFSLLHDRGNALGPFHSNTHKWLLENFIIKKQENIKISDNCVKDIMVALKEYGEIKVRQETVIINNKLDDKDNDKIINIIYSNLEDDNKTKLRSLILYREGLAACRYEIFTDFLKLSDIQIEKINSIHKYNYELSLPLHRAIYNTPVNERAGLIISLRNISYFGEKSIAEEFNKNQKILLEQDLNSTINYIRSSNCNDIEYLSSQSN